MDRIVNRHAGETVAIFTHAGVVNLYIGGIIGAQQAIWTAPANAGISSVLADRRGRRMLLSLNEMSHVRGLVTPAAQRPGSSAQTAPHGRFKINRHRTPGLTILKRPWTAP
jgi:hypothetical protein